MAVVSPAILKALTGELSINSGRRVLGQRLRMGIFSQDLAQSLPGDETALSYVMLRCPGVLPLDIRRVFGAIGLSGNSHEQEISLLSGGEKARVALTELALGRYNVLILDEPTNHLDTDSAEALTLGLQAFEGAIVFVSHDRSLLEAIATHSVVIEGSKAIYHSDLRFPSQDNLTAASGQQQSKSANPPNQHELFKKLRNRLRRMTNQRLELEEQIDGHELRLSHLDTELIQVGTDSEKITKLAIERAKISQELENSMSHWEELCAEEEELEAQLRM